MASRPFSEKAPPPPLEIIIDRPGGVFAAGETVRGIVSVYTAKAMTHSGIFLTADGHISTRKALRGGVFDAIPAAKSVKLLGADIALAEPGKLADGKTPFAFDFVIPSGSNVFETYHGMHVEVRYSITAEVRRGKLAKDLKETIPFIVVNPGQSYDSKAPSEPIPFHLTPAQMKKKAQQTGARFDIKGQLDSPRMDVAKPLTGHIDIVHSDVAIKSIELQLIRVEEVLLEGSVGSPGTELEFAL